MVLSRTGRLRNHPVLLLLDRDRCLTLHADWWHARFWCFRLLLLLLSACLLLNWSLQALLLLLLDGDRRDWSLLLEQALKLASLGRPRNSRCSRSPRSLHNC